MRRIRLALPLAFVLFLADCSTKELAVEHLTPEHVAHPVIGDFLRFTLVYNDGAAMSLPIGPFGRWLLVGLGSAIVVGLLWAALNAPRSARAQQIALGFLLGGAIGNLTGRIFSERGVVDFIDLGVGDWRFYVFNVADIAIAIGACLFAYTLYCAAPRASPDTAT